MEVNNKTITSQTTIDYKVIDTDKLSEIDEANKLMITDGKVTIESIKSNFRSQGATCR